MPVLLADQRKYPRVTVSLAAWWGETPVCMHRGRVVNIGLGGCFIQTMQPFGEGKTVFFRFAEATMTGLPTGVLQCRIVYRLEGFGFGVEFVQMSTDDEERVRDLVSSHLDDEDVVESNSVSDI